MFGMLGCREVGNIRWLLFVNVGKGLIIMYFVCYGKKFIFFFIGYRELLKDFMLNLVCKFWFVNFSYRIRLFNLYFGKYILVIVVIIVKGIWRVRYISEKDL